MPVCRLQSLAAIFRPVVSQGAFCNLENGSALTYFFSPGRKTLNGRFTVPVHARVKLLPPSVQVCVPLRSACRRTNAPLYFASY